MKSKVLSTGMSHLDAKSSGSLGIATLIWVFSTQIVCVILGITLAVAIHPGKNLGGDVPSVTTSTEYTDIFGDFLR